MADKKISALTGATIPLDGTEVLPIVQGSATVKVANNDLRPKQIQSNATSGVLQVAGPGTAATRVMTTPDANFTAARTDAAQSFTGDQTLSTGNIVQGIAAKGVNFTANTPAAGMTSQLLNWYEEGLVTASITTSSGSITLNSSFNKLKYTRVGRMVSITGLLYVASVSTPAGIATVTGLPFANGSAQSNVAGVCIFATGLAATATTAVQGRIESNATVIILEKFTAGASTSIVGDIQADTQFKISTTYFV